MVLNHNLKKSALVRVPIRLGADSFVHGKISEENILRMIDALEAFKLLMNVHSVERYKACATSAMREASNGIEIVEEILKKTGVKIDIIGGKEEAAIISSTDLHELISGDKSYLYVDVGGGSTEFTIFSKGEIVKSKSFKIGTVRVLNNTKSQNKEAFKRIETWIKGEHLRVSKNFFDWYLEETSISSLKCLGEQKVHPISYIYLNAQYQFLKKMSYSDRITELSLNPDRADVIIPATKILPVCHEMEWSS